MILGPWGNGSGDVVFIRIGGGGTIDSRGSWPIIQVLVFSTMIEHDVRPTTELSYEWGSLRLRGGLSVELK